MSEVGQTRIETFVVARDGLFRMGLIKLVEDSRRLRLGGSADGSRETLAVLTRNAFDVVVIGFRTGDTSGFELTTALRDSAVTVPILLVADHTTGDEAIKALSSGATGFITASATPAEVVEAIQNVAGGHGVVGSEVGAALVPELQRRAQLSTALTEREIDILNELAAGGTAKEIADRMHLAVPTIKNHVANLYAKLGVRDRGAAVAEAMRQGWIQ